MSENEIVLRGAAFNESGEALANYAASYGANYREGSASIAPLPSFPLAAVPQKTQVQLLRMFGDPNVLDKAERADLVSQLSECVKANPRVSELRVIFGMALCVNLEVPDAIEELREGVRLAPDSFLANLKMGELWMRLRVMDKAEQHTHRAALLAANRVQAELARRQGASVRAMKFAGIERGGYQGPTMVLARFARALGKVSRLWKPQTAEAIAGVDAGCDPLSKMTGDFDNA